LTRSVTSSRASLCRRVDPDDRVEQLARIRVGGGVEDLVEVAALDDHALIHDQNTVGDLGDDAEVMGDQDRCQPAFAVESLEQGKDLGLHGHVEGGGGLVGDQGFRIERQRHRDHRPLSHAAGEFVRVIVDAALRVGNPDRVEHLDRALMRFALARLAPVGADRLGDLVTDLVDGVEGGHRVLEDHADPRPAHSAQLPVVCLQQLPIAELHRTSDLGVGRAREAEDRLRGNALARAGLADDRQYLSGRELEGDPVDRLHPAALGIEGDPQVLDREQHLAHTAPFRCALCTHGEQKAHRSVIASRFPA
jgi:hypothetical protein